MREVFPEFYRPDPGDERRFITSGVVVVDTNVLLGLYEFSAQQRGEALSVLETIGDRLWIPHRVAWEYQYGRLNVIKKQAGHYDKLVNLIRAPSADDAAESLQDLRIPPEVANEVRPLLAQFAPRLDEIRRDYADAVEAIRERHVVTPEQGLSGDPVRDHLDRLFDGRVGAAPSADERARRIEEAKRRSESLIPPGYKDADKAGDEQQAGDYLLWAELLDHAEASKEDGRPFLFVTNDVKEDWYEKADGGPRRELVREFLAVNPSGYHQITLEALLRLAREHLNAEVDDATIEKASELSRPRMDLDFLSAYDAAMMENLLSQGVSIQDARNMIDAAYNELAVSDREDWRSRLERGDVAAARDLLADHNARTLIAHAAQMTDTQRDAGRRAWADADPATLKAADRVLNDPAVQRAIRDFARRNRSAHSDDASSNSEDV